MENSGQIILQPIINPFGFFSLDLKSQLPQKYVDELNLQWRRVHREVDQKNCQKTHYLPISRIKKIIKQDDDTREFDESVPLVLEKGIEMFVIELTVRALANTEVQRRRTVKKEDVEKAFQTTELFDFLCSFSGIQSMIPKSVPIIQQQPSQNTMAGNQQRIIPPPESIEQPPTLPNPNAHPALSGLNNNFETNQFSDVMFLPNHMRDNM